MEPIKGVKGFNVGLKCRGFQYEIGKDYGEPTAKVCESGFHFCESPLDVFSYYPPAESEYAEVKGSGQIDKHGDDSKVACTKIHIVAKIGLVAMVNASVKFIFDRVDWKNKKETNTGDWSAATVSGKESVACGLGFECKARGSLGSWIVLAERNDYDKNYSIKTVKTVKVDGKKIKSDTFYILRKGKFVVVKEQP